jgi:uncharacterized membrane protein
MHRAGPVLLIRIGDKQLGFAFCHRQEDRCLKIFGHTSFLCARCTGLCIGAILSIFVLYTKITLPFFLIGILCLPLLIDGFSQMSGMRKSNNALRFFTGVLFAVGMMSFLFQV